jgi:hypothetical protein
VPKGLLGRLRPFAPPVHSRAAPFTGAGASAMDAATAELIAAGLQIVESGPSLLRARSWGMWSTREPALRCASEIDIAVEGGRLQLRAALGGYRVPLGIHVLMALALPAGLFVLYRVAGGARLPWMMVLSGAPWIALALVFARRPRGRAVLALDALFARMLAAAENDGHRESATEGEAVSPEP